MSTSNIEELMALADRYATLRIGEGTANARKELHDAMQSQAERIKELERESETHSKAYGQQCAAHARELALNEAIAICRRNAQNTSADELEALKGK